MSGQNARDREENLLETNQRLIDENRELKTMLKTLINNHAFNGEFIECNIEKAKGMVG